MTGDLVRDLRLGGRNLQMTERGVPAFKAMVATAAVIGVLTAARLEWANYSDARTMGDAVTAALALLEVQPPQ
jgi:hypothetical protein